MNEWIKQVDQPIITREETKVVDRCRYLCCTYHIPRSSCIAREGKDSVSVLYRSITMMAMMMVMMMLRAAHIRITIRRHFLKGGRIQSG